MSPKSRDEELTAELYAARDTGASVVTELRTDKRVLARVTDGIYREPSSAIRELIANAYDADATVVRITTNPPQFDQIIVRDDGMGMSIEALVHLIGHIGGSAKRTEKGAELGITSDSSDYTPSGRRIIGKIGIGLFSVSQLTRFFRILTKRKGDRHRLVADVQLRAYNEELKQEVGSDDQSESITSGNVQITFAQAESAEAHGTELILLKLAPAARTLLRSDIHWGRVLGTPDQDVDDEERLSPPMFHVGSPDFRQDAALPWGPQHPSHLSRFCALVDAVEEAKRKSNGRPSIQSTFDYYFQMIWRLALAVPLPYIDGEHPFLMPSGQHGIKAYALQNSKAGQAEPIEDGERAVDRLALDEETFQAPAFRVIVDDLELRRPISPRRMAELAPKDRKPMIFFGSYAPGLEAIAQEQSGGNTFAISGYFMWTPTLIPSDHSGTLVRIAGASGTLFDGSFLGYKVQETTRLAQTCSEIFVHSGLESALNIDRESFNFGHPHTKLLTAWTHRALRQVANTEKRVASERREVLRRADLSARQSAVRQFAERVLGEFNVIDLPEVVLGEAREGSPEDGTLCLERSTVLQHVLRDAQPKTQTAKLSKRIELFEDAAREVARVLLAFGVAEHLGYQQFEDLVSSIVGLFWVGES